MSDIWPGLPVLFQGLQNTTTTGAPSGVNKKDNDTLNKRDFLQKTLLVEQKQTINSVLK